MSIMEYMSLLREIVLLILITHVPIFLIPLSTWFWGGLFVMLRARKWRVRLRAFLLVVLSVPLFLWLYVMPFSSFPSGSGLEYVKLLALSGKHWFGTWHGDSLLWGADAEIVALRVLLEFTGTTQKWLRLAKKWLWRTVLVLTVVAIVVAVLLSVFGGMPLI